MVVARGRGVLPVLLPPSTPRGYGDRVAAGPAVRPARARARDAGGTRLPSICPDASPGPARRGVAAAFDLPPRSSPSASPTALWALSVAAAGSGDRPAPPLCGLERIRRLRGAAELASRSRSSRPEPPSSRNSVVEPPALETGTPWLAVRAYDGRFATVGPLIVPESCVSNVSFSAVPRTSEYGDRPKEIEQAPLSATADAALEAVVGALAAHLVLRWVAGHDTTLPGILYAVERGPRSRSASTPSCGPAVRRAQTSSARRPPPLARGRSGVTVAELASCLERAVSPYAGSSARSTSACTRRPTPPASGSRARSVEHGPARAVARPSVGIGGAASLAARPPPRVGEALERYSAT